MTSQHETHKELAHKLAELEQHLEDHDEQIQTIFEAIHQLMTPPERPRKIHPVKFSFLHEHKMTQIVR